MAKLNHERANRARLVARVGADAARPWAPGASSRALALFDPAEPRPVEVRRRAVMRAAATWARGRPVTLAPVAGL